jgi:catechol 2,3-dioxygenase
MTMHLAEMVAWYELVCGLQPVYYSEQAAWLTNDAANHRIALIAFPGIKAPVDKPHTAGLHHVAFEYASITPWMDNYIRLRDNGVTPVLSVDHGMTMSMYYVDPEGNGVEIQFDVFTDWSKSKEWMWASREFSEDQIGPQFDPEKLLAAYLEGIPADDLHRRAYAGEYVPDNPPHFGTLPDVWGGSAV